MEPSKFFQNLLSGKQALPTVACPSCAAQVPEFRIHSHLDTCLTTLPEQPANEEPAVEEPAAQEFSDGDQSRHHRRGRARGQAKGRGRGRKRRDGAEINNKKDTKRARNAAENEKVLLDAPDDDDDDDANVYQQWEYSVDELAKSRNGNPLSDLQKQELFACGVLTIERHEAVSAMVLELDRLLADTEGTADVRFQIPALSEVGVLEQVSRSSTRMTTADGEGYAVVTRSG